MNHLAQVKSGIYFIRMQRDGAYFWHYVRVSGHKEALLKKWSGDTTLDLTEFGVILDSGWGIEAPLLIRQKYEAS